MTQRFICPHCHSPLDPRTMDDASTGDSALRICPVCDEPIVLTTRRAAQPSSAAASTRLAENGAR